MTNSLNLKQPWEEVKEKLKENDITLSDDDLQLEPGKENELLEKLSKKMNKPPEEVRKFIESIAANKSKAG